MIGGYERRTRISGLADGALGSHRGRDVLRVLRDVPVRNEELVDRGRLWDRDTCRSLCLEPSKAQPTMTSRKKPGVAFWATVLLVGLVLYVLSIGPVMWLGVRKYLPDWALGARATIYRPMIWLVEDGPRPIGRAIEWYAALWLPPQPESVPNFDNPRPVRGE